MANQVNQLSDESSFAYYNYKSKKTEKKWAIQFQQARRHKIGA